MVVVELETGLQKSLHPAILGVHGISLENMENMEKMENINQMREGLRIFFRCKS